MNEKLVDARGLACPLPVVNTKEAIKELGGQGTVTVLVDNEIAVQNLQKFAVQRQFGVSAHKKNDSEYEVVIRLGASSAPESARETEPCVPDQRTGGLVVAIGSEAMGEGAGKLGRILMKSFLFALTKQDILPETLLFFNSGAFLTSSDSDSLEDLRTLEAAGVRILTCGTCADFYNIKEKLAVGGVSNMYEIVEILEHAKSVIRP